MRHVLVIFFKLVQLRVRVGTDLDRVERLNARPQDVLPSVEADQIVPKYSSRVVRPAPQRIHVTACSALPSFS